MHLELLTDARSPEIFPISKATISIGRDPGCDIPFEGSAIVSRQHAKIVHSNDGLTIEDGGSFNGTIVNRQRITSKTPLFHNDEIELGAGGPRMRIAAPDLVRSAVVSKPTESKTVVVDPNVRPAAPDKPQLVATVSLAGKSKIVAGRAGTCEVRLNELQVSNEHAVFSMEGGGLIVKDLNSTNGVFVNGDRISRMPIGNGDIVQIGSFQIVPARDAIEVFDTRARTRIDAIGITKEVKDRSGGGVVRLLDDVTLSIQPNEFVGLLGPSGAGKSTLMDAMNGMRPASRGAILINNLDLYQHLDSLKQSIGYVPQDDIIHRELTVDRTLYYVAKLRLSGDVSPSEVSKIVDEVLNVTGLLERRNVPVNQLSGGQRKRVSIAVELITKPSVIFLDEPTSGLDPATEEKIMKLFRTIADSGRTIILTTHAMENVKLFDKIVVMMRGKLVFYGTPNEALDHLGASSFKELYDKLEEPIASRLKNSRGGDIKQVTEDVAEGWKGKFLKTPQYRKNVHEPVAGIDSTEAPPHKAKNRLGFARSIKQWMILSKRYREVLCRDKLNLLILFAQAPIVAGLTYLVMGSDQTRDFVYFILALVAVWFGTSVAAREIIRERPVYDRERMVNLGLLPYLFSKFLVLGGIVGIQCILLFLPLKVLDLLGLMPMPGEMLGAPQLGVMVLTAFVGIAIGLFISAKVKTSELATSLVPLILIPQILFSGLIGVPTGLNKTVGLLMPAAWSFDAIKRFSTLDTLEVEGADPNSEIGGRGYYKYIELENDRIIRESKEKIDAYKASAEKKIDDFEADLKAGLNPPKPQLDPPPKPDDAKRIDKKEMSGYISFLHPWMSKWLNQIMLMFLLVILTAGTLVVLRSQDVN